MATPQTTQKPKVDVQAILNRAKNTTAEVKKSTAVADAKKNDYKIVPKFSNYEFNGKILRNAKTKNIISYNQAKNRYQLKSDEGKQCDVSLDKLKGFFPAEVKPAKDPAVKKIKEPKAEGEKIYTGEKHVVKPKDTSELKADAKKIMESEMKSFDQIIALFNCGYDKASIIEITGRRNDVVSKYLRPLLKKK